MTLQHVIWHLADAVVAKEHRGGGIWNRIRKRIQLSDVLAESLLLGAQFAP